MTNTPSASGTGTYVHLGDGRPAVRFTRTYPHPIERVWRFVTEPAELVHWFPSRVEVDLRPGGEMRFSFDPNTPDSVGRVLALDPPRHLSFVWDADELHFDLEPAGSGGTRFTLTNVLAEDDTAARNAAGWQVCLDALDAAANGEHRDGPHAGPTGDWKGYYDAYVAQGVPSGAHIPGVDDVQ
ncbi:SRPBCC family protein [Streptodolium elevatio]|uniref:SRPBCC family protein n=1 Tax=Streptodolium elevatio TaxID=3157996 RepID=A0ABV3DPY6_9ACTN